VDDRFPHQTVAMLKQFNKLVSTPEYIATTGWTTSNLLEGIASANKPKNYDIVSLLIGVNNQYQGKDSGEYRIQFTQCLDKAINFAGGRKTRVFVLSIPDYSVTPFASRLDKAKISKEIDWFNKINEQVTKGKGVEYINITPGSRDAAIYPTLVASDGLHPSREEYNKWANLLSTKIKELL
jgi:lysophospholipase L1-like esterase